MATQTARLGLRKPDPNPTTGDNVDVETDINESMDKIDAAIGYHICTSGTRPVGAERWNGRPILETDTGKTYVWSQTIASWVEILTSASVPSTVLAYKTAEPQNNTTTMLNDPQLVLNIPSAGRWQFFGPIWFRTSAAADFKFAFVCDGVGITDARFSTSESKQMYFDTQVVNIPQVHTFQAVEVMGAFQANGPGSLTLQWAQQVADAGPTFVLTQSWLRAERAGS